MITWVVDEQQTVSACRVVFSALDEDTRHTSRTLESSVRSYTLDDLDVNKDYSVCVEVLFNMTSSTSADIWDSNLERSCVDVTSDVDESSSSEEDVNEVILYVVLPASLAALTTIIVIIICFTVVLQRQKTSAEQEENASYSINTGLLADAAVTSTPDDGRSMTSRHDTATVSTCTDDTLAGTRRSEESLDNVLATQRASMVDRSSISIMTMPPSMRAAALSALKDL